MERARRYWITGIVVSSLVGGFVALTACSNYAEGERCESLNNNDDCVDGLQCIPKSQLVSPFNGSDRCCPPDRTRATTQACAIPQSGIGGDAAPPADTGPATDANGTDTSMPDTSVVDAADAAEGG